MTSSHCHQFIGTIRSRISGDSYRLFTQLTLVKMSFFEDFHPTIY